MSLGLNIRLSIMMFLQYFVWGIWLPILGIHLGSEEVGLTPAQIGWVYTVYGFGAILGPFLLGQLADRYMATERVLGLAHLIGGVLLLVTAYVTGFWPIFLLLFAYCNLYMPTMGLTNSITFRTAGEGNQDLFPGIRLWGTIGWIAAGLLFAAYRNSTNVAALRPLFDLVSEPSSRDCLRISGVVSLFYGLYCFTLPHTPPTRVDHDTTQVKKSAILESLELLKVKSFAVLVLVAGLIGIMLAFYFACENIFLKDIGTPEESIGGYMVIGQVAEALVIGLVPFVVNRFGVKNTMLLGAGAWAVRFGLSSIGQPWWLMIATIGLHGFAFAFFFVVAQMYVDRAAGPDIKATAQNLLIFIIYGLGTIVGSLMTGYVRDYFENDWRKVWAGPFVLTLICMVIFALLFRDTAIQKKSVVTEGDPLLA
ncbi:MFS transporter [Tundrisphaera lichenicola]|uniref:MFS transporter n=1 Tax=Tundrisphaera lichenicola TaxID=2029860 RepID=UPI003EC11F4D